MEIVENYRGVRVYYDYLITDETGVYGVAFESKNLDSYRTYLLDLETKTPIADTGSTQEWPEFYRRGWTKSELWAGQREAWNLPTGKEAEKKFWGGRLNPKEFAAIRWLLGLEVTELASRLGVNERTVRRWEKGTTSVPDGVAVEVREWFSAFLDSQDKALDVMHEIYKLSGRVSIPIADTKPERAFTRIQYLLACMEDLEPAFAD